MDEIGSCATDIARERKRLLNRERQRRSVARREAGEPVQPATVWPPDLLDKLVGVRLITERQSFDMKAVAKEVPGWLGLLCRMLREREKHLTR